jgi:inhibitor of cysteine peptidase
MLLAACGDDGGVVVLTDLDSGTEVLVAAGETFEVHLTSNPSTGFGWEVDAMSTPGLVTLTSRNFEDPPDSDLVGAAGTEVFVFEATGEGAGILRLAYLRPFEDRPVPQRVAEFIVRIDEAPWPPDREGSAQPSISTATASAGIGINALVASGAIDGITVSGFVVWDPNGAHLCEALAESFPPQCGGARVPITNPDELGLALEENQGVRWTDQRVDFTGNYDGTGLTVTN